MHSKHFNENIVSAHRDGAKIDLNCVFGTTDSAEENY